jgi:hypothetical protein
LLVPRRQRRLDHRHGIGQGAALKYRPALWQVWHSGGHHHFTTGEILKQFRRCFVFESAIEGQKGNIMVFSVL